MTVRIHDVPETEYILGHSDRGIRRLMHQVAILRPITEGLPRARGSAGACGFSTSAAVPAMSRCSPPSWSAQPARSSASIATKMSSLSPGNGRRRPSSDKSSSRRSRLHPDQSLILSQVDNREKGVEHERTATLAATRPDDRRLVGSRAIYVAAKLQIANLLADGPQLVEQFAEAAGVAPRPLYRVLRALAGVAGRCAVEGGDFFEVAPCGADAYLLGHVLHDWDDAKAGLILDNLRRAMPAKARLLVVEYVLPAGDKPSFGKLTDLTMMVMAGGLERTEAEYRRLFAAHGFRLTRVVPTAGDISVVEGVPA